MSDEFIELPEINVYDREPPPPPIGELAAQDRYEPSTRAPFVRGEINTPLSQLDEFAFRQWAKDNKVPFDVEAGQSDYDMRGYWRALQNQDPRAKSGIDPNDNRIHYPDTYKTPSHKTFSNESLWARPDSPGWTEDDKLVTPGGRVIFDDRAPRDPFGEALVRMSTTVEQPDRVVAPQSYKPAPGVPTAQYFDDQWLENFMKRQAERERR